MHALMELRVSVAYEKRDIGVSLETEYSVFFAKVGHFYIKCMH